MENKSNFNVICPNCGAGSRWLGKREEMVCSNCKKTFKVKDGEAKLKELRL